MNRKHCPQFFCGLTEVKMERKITRRMVGLCNKTQEIIKKGSDFAKVVLANPSINANTTAQEWSRIQQEYDIADVKIEATLETLEDLKSIWSEECSNAVDFLHKFDEVYRELITNKTHKKT